MCSSTRGIKYFDADYPLTYLYPYHQRCLCLKAYVRCVFGGSSDKQVSFDGRVSLDGQRIGVRLHIPSLFGTGFTSGGTLVAAGGTEGNWIL